MRIRSNHYRCTREEEKEKATVRKVKTKGLTREGRDHYIYVCNVMNIDLMNIKQCYIKFINEFSVLLTILDSYEIKNMAPSQSAHLDDKNQESEIRDSYLR